MFCYMERFAVPPRPPIQLWLNNLTFQISKYLWKFSQLGALKFNSIFGFHILITNITKDLHHLSSCIRFFILDLKKRLIFITDKFESIFL